jgi:hypothetical protein
VNISIPSLHTTLPSRRSSPSTEPLHQTLSHGIQPAQYIRSVTHCPTIRGTVLELAIRPASAQWQIGINSSFIYLSASTSRATRKPSIAGSASITTSPCAAHRRAGEQPSIVLPVSLGREVAVHTWRTQLPSTEAVPQSLARDSPMGTVGSLGRFVSRPGIAREVQSCPLVKQNSLH